MTATDKERLRRIHYLRMKAHWGKKWADENAFAPHRWPEDDKAWRAVEHNAHPADSNVEMAKFHFSLARDLQRAGLI